MLICDKCNAAISEGAKFCPQCGDPVTEADIANAPILEGSPANVEISFGYSSSANFETAVNICNNLPTHEIIGEGNRATHRVTLPITETELVIRLFELVGSWKSSRMLINGQPATKKDLTYYGVGCYRTRIKAYKPEQYCFGEREYEANIWGCKRMNMPISIWGGGWLSYGTMSKSGVWTFDKDRIRHELQIAIKENELCPILNRKQILETLDKLPESINPNVDPGWEYTTTYEDTSDGSYRQVATGIKPVPKNVNKYVISGYTPTWDLEQGNDQPTREVTFQIDSTPKPRQSRKKAKASGCLIPIIGIVIIGLMAISLF